MEDGSALESTGNAWSSDERATSHGKRDANSKTTPPVGVPATAEQNRTEEAKTKSTDQSEAVCLKDEIEDLHVAGHELAQHLDSRPMSSVEALEDLLRGRDAVFDESSSRTLRRLLDQLPPHTAQYAFDELQAATAVRKPTAFVVRMLQRRVEKRHAA